MRRLEFIIKQLRDSTNNFDTNKLSDFIIQDYLNRAQRVIQKIIFTALPESNVFAKEGTAIDFVKDQEAYDLPSDIYAQNSINSVYISSDQENYSKLNRIPLDDRQVNYGYFTIDKKIYIAPVPSSAITSALKIVYTYKLPEISVRLGKVTAFTSGTSVKVSTSYGDDISEKYDFFCIVDRDGEIKEEGLRITGYSASTGTISTDSTFTNITTNDYVVLGKRATSHSYLPDACEDYLLQYTERKIFHHDSSRDVSDQTIFTQQEKNDLIGLFQNNVLDVIYPPITDTDYFIY